MLLAVSADEPLLLPAESAAAAAAATGSRMAATATATARTTTKATASTPLEKDHASLVASLAHEADLVLALRPLDTGAAGDVDGVLRITRGGHSDVACSSAGMYTGTGTGTGAGMYTGNGTGTGTDTGVEERELLYRVGVDGRVTVFPRGHEAG